MTKEEFVAEALILLNNRIAVSFRKLNHEKYGISRTTAYRTLASLRKCNIIQGKGSFLLTQRARERLCENCNYRKKALREMQKKHREITRKLHSRT